jgi:hypothetical protein
MKGLKRAADLAQKLAEQESGAKLSADAFEREALEAAGATTAHIDLIEEELRHPDYASAQQLVRKLAETIGSANVHSVPPADRMAMFIRAYSGEAAEAQLATLGCKGSYAFALAVRHAANRYPDRFGVIDDWQAYQKTLDDLRNEYQSALVDINFGIADLIVDYDSVSNEERARGLCRVSFSCTSGEVTLGQNWRQRLVNWQLAKPNKAAA